MDRLAGTHRGPERQRFTVIRGPHYQPDQVPRRRAAAGAGGRTTRTEHGPHFEPDRLPRNRFAGPSGQRADDADSQRWTCMAMMEVPPLDAVRLWTGLDSADWSLHAAGPDNPARDIFQDLLG